MDSVGETPRGVHATRVLSARKDFTLPTLIEAAYDPYLTAFADLIPTLVKAYDETPDGDPTRPGWRRRWRR
jgi:acyl-homoserine-lactone acylase